MTTRAKIAIALYEANVMIERGNEDLYLAEDDGEFHVNTIGAGISLQSAFDGLGNEETKAALDYIVQCFE